MSMKLAPEPPSPSHAPATGSPSTSTILPPLAIQLPKCPTIVLDAERVSDIMAARLATCLLGHILYLKSQVPFPVAQLSQMSAGENAQSKTRAAKKHDELLTAFDLLSSHLGTTFTALSTALARNVRAYPFLPGHHPEIETDMHLPEKSERRRRKAATAHMVFILGPSATSAHAAKARILFEIDGLDVRIWGEREMPANNDANDDGDAIHLPALPSLTQPSHPREDDASSLSSQSSSSSNSNSNSDSQSDSDSDLDSDSDSDFDSIIDSEGVSDDTDDETSQVDEEALRTAERLLSRALALANSDAEMGMAAELPPTQTHVLLRAPRRFEHPAWVPRQGIVKALDVIVAEAQERLGGEQKGKQRAGVKTECVRVQCRAGADANDGGSVERVVSTEDDHDEKVDGQEGDADGEVDEDEDNEMIWWSWDGKLVGFSEW